MDRDEDRVPCDTPLTGCSYEMNIDGTGKCVWCGHEIDNEEDEG